MLRLLDVGLSPQRLGFNLRPVHVGFVMKNVALVQVCLSELRFSPVSIIPPLLHIHVSLVYHRRYIILATDSIVKQNTRLVRQKKKIYIYIYILKHINDISNYAGHEVVQMVEALRYRPEGSGIDSRWDHWIFH
jgi:hypothetical protein